MTTVRKAEWNAVLLAGGRSVRMGRDKALLPWDGGTLLAHMHGLLHRAGAGRIVVSGDRPDHAGVPDGRPGGGPMAALAHLCPRLPDGLWLVVPVDMPLLSVGLLQALRRTVAPCACIAGHALPMALRLDAQVRRAVEDVGALEGRACSLRALQERLQVERLDAAPWFDALRNCNTPEEWEALHRGSR